MSEQGPAYSVAPLRTMPRYFLGKDNASRACLLIAVRAGSGRSQAPIRLASLDVQFGIHSLIRSGGETSAGTFSIVCCRSSETETVHYFLSLVETIVTLLGQDPSEAEIARAVNRLVLIFQRLQSVPTRSVNGLFGELFIIHQSRLPPATLRAWRIQNASRFDFTQADARLDAKTTSGRLRIHTFSYEQCNPPPGTIAIVASLFVEQVSNGFTLRSLVDDIASKVKAHPDLTVKLHETVAETLGSSFNESIAVGFDWKLARASIRYYDLRAVPAIRGELPAGVGDLHFRSDLSGLQSLSASELEGPYPDLASLLPQSV